MHFVIEAREIGTEDWATLSSYFFEDGNERGRAIAKKMAKANFWKWGQYLENSEFQIVERKEATRAIEDTGDNDNHRNERDHHHRKRADTKERDGKGDKANGNGLRPEDDNISDSGKGNEAPEQVGWGDDGIFYSRNSREAGREGDHRGIHSPPPSPKRL